MKMSGPERKLADQLTKSRIPFEQEYRICQDRKWRADFFIPPTMLVEVEGGGVKAGGHHFNKEGILNDFRKYNRAQQLGFKVYRFLPEQVESGEAIAWIVYCVNN